MTAHDKLLELANRASCDLTGYSEAEIVSRNCRFLAGRDDSAPRRSIQIISLVRGGETGRG